MLRHAADAEMPHATLRCRCLFVAAFRRLFAYFAADAAARCYAMLLMLRHGLRHDATPPASFADVDSAAIICRRPPRADYDAAILRFAAFFFATPLLLAAADFRRLRFTLMILMPRC